MNGQDIVAATSGDIVAVRKRGNGRRWGMLFLVVLLAAMVVAAYMAWYELVGKRFEKTDNAYVQGHIVQVTPQQAGTVIEVAARDTDFVQAGQLLIRLDGSDAKVALARAEAQLAQTVREVNALYGNNDTLVAQVRARRAEAARASSEVQRLETFYQRRVELARSGLISSEALNTAKNELSAARSSLEAARASVSANRQQLSTSRSFTANTSVAEHPNVLSASASIRAAMLAVERTHIRAPVSGYIARRRVQLGQRVEPGQSMMAVVPLADVWVDANFKESQLRNMRIGQPVELTADLYGSDVVYNGTVEGLGAGTGAAFAILPAQNATGNWIKIIQRVPVRVSLDEESLQAHPLRIGLSMHATVTVENTDGERMASAPRLNRTEVLDSPTDFEISAEATITAIIARNLGVPVAGGRSSGKIAGRSAATKRR
ncbi:MAG: HlyD family efflux transporter periplasmic adaptor subunit [Burkholderiaceae bacterium]